MVLKTLALFFALLCSAARTDNAPETVYKAKGDEVVLMPTDKAPPFPDIEWKHGNDIAAELDNGKTKCFGQFKDRCTLNNSTGELTITGLTVKDNGLYTLKINGKDTNTKIQLNVISPVSKPTISKSCNPEMTYCDLICESNTTDAEPITYIWVAGDSVGPLSRVFKITKDMKEDSFRCILVNPLGREERSESIPNPFKPSAPVSKPIISQSCNPEMTYCDLTCEGSATDAEPITYKWVAGDSVGPLSRSRVFKITKDMEEDSFSCIMVDPFGREEHSESIPNPFKTSGVLNRSHISTIIVVAAVILLILYFIFKYIKEESRIRLMKRAEDNGWKAQKTTDGKCRILQMVVSETYDDDATTTMTTLPTSIALKTTNGIVFYFNEPARKLLEANEEQPDRVTVVPGGLSQEPPQAAAPDTSEDTEMPSGAAETSNQDQASAASPQTTKEAEMHSLRT